MSDLSADHPRRLLMVAHARLTARPAAATGMKSATVAAYGDHTVRLVVLSHGLTTALAPIWLELTDTATESALDSSGCHDLGQAMAAAEELLAEAKRLNAGSLPCGRKGSIKPVPAPAPRRETR